ncbi:MAG: Mg2+ and Co2+ transporter CorB [Clostridia bacterium]|nr:Mg2+ and Co2+ transporter CorB [Clostridia bacterium]
MEKQEDSNSSIEIQKDEEIRHSNQSEKKHKKQPKKKRNLWSVKITVVSFFVSAFISFLSELTASAEHIIVTILLLFFLILCSILFDGIGVASTSCDMTPFVSMASRKVYGAKTALWLVKNNEKVSNVCSDVVGDIFGIVSGACAAAITLKVVVGMEDVWQKLVTISISGVVSALTIGGKAFLKNIAIKNSKEFIMFIARLIAVFNPDERRKKKKQKEKQKKFEQIEESKEKHDVEG